MWIWIGPDGWMVDGAICYKGDALASGTKADKILWLQERGFIMRAQAEPEPPPTIIVQVEPDLEDE